MQHSSTLTAEIRDLPPQDGWRTVETTGHAGVTCSCGFGTGPIPTPDAMRMLQDHLEPLAPRA